MVDTLALVKMFCEKHPKQRLEFQPWMTDENPQTLRIDVRPCSMCLAEHWADAVADR